MLELRSSSGVWRISVVRKEGDGPDQPWKEVTEIGPRQCLSVSKGRVSEDGSGSAR